jgi:DNA anti-recombination protein RmuC
MYRMDWTDDRLRAKFDSLDRRLDEVDRRFDRVDESLRELRSTMGQMNQRFDGLEHTLVHGVLALTGAIIAGFAAMIVLIATQL